MWKREAGRRVCDDPLVMSAFGTWRDAPSRAYSASMSASA